VHTWQWRDSALETLVTIDLDPVDDGETLLRLTHARFPDTELRDLHKGGWGACLDSLEDWLDEVLAQVLRI
jgi:uncharacterized protein YndB with AHSA1/START domain